MSISRRVFIVGVPRSGTTLLQSFLVSHSRIHTFPETHIFSIILGDTAKKYNIVVPKKIRKYCRLLADLDGDPKDFGFKRFFPLLPASAIRTHFIRFLDQETEKLGKDIWLEKTPAHLRAVDYITRHVPDALFIHIIRDGKDVVTSLFEASNKHPDKWGGPRSIEKSVRRWNKEIQLTRARAGHPGHHILEYEKLVEQTGPELERICSFINIDFEDAMIADRLKNVDSIIQKDESWKENNFHEVGKPESKFDSILTEQQREFINANITDYEEIKNMISEYTA